MSVDEPLKSSGPDAGCRAIEDEEEVRALVHWLYSCCSAVTVDYFSENAKLVLWIS
jgi:hypothetical protein